MYDLANDNSFPRGKTRGDEPHHCERNYRRGGVGLFIASLPGFFKWSVKMVFKKQRRLRALKGSLR